MAEEVTNDEAVVEETKPVAKKAAAKKTAAPKPAKSDKVALRLTGGYHSLETQWGTASQASPFILVDADEADAAIASGYFAKATAEEVKAAYGR